MLHPQTRLAWIDDTIGLGVVATHRILKGTVVWALDPLDLAFTRAQVAALGPDYAHMLRRYAYDEKGAVILCWDHARFVNHHCEATCMAGEDGFELAVRDIEPGEQLTDDYGTLGLDESMQCACGSPACRGVVHPDDRVRLGAEWNRRFVGALAFSTDVPQALDRVVGSRLHKSRRRHLGHDPAPLWSSA